MVWQEDITEWIQMVSIWTVVTSLHLQLSILQYMLFVRSSSISTKRGHTSLFSIFTPMLLEGALSYTVTLSTSLINRWTSVSFRRYCLWTVECSNMGQVILLNLTCIARIGMIACRRRALEGLLCLILLNILILGHWSATIIPVIWKMLSNNDENNRSSNTRSIRIRWILTFY